MVAENRGRPPQPGRSQRRIWTLSEVRALGLTTDLETAAQIIGIGRTLAYELAKKDRFPVQLLRLGRRVVVPVHEVLNLLSCDLPGQTPDPRSPDEHETRPLRPS